MAGRVWDTGRPLLIDEYDAWDGRSASFPKGVVRSLVGVPLRSSDDTIGVLGVARPASDARGFSSDDVEALTRFAQLASIALDAQPHSGWMRNSAPGFCARVRLMCSGSIPACT